MKKFCLTGLLATIAPFLFAQQADAFFKTKEAKRIEMKLSSDEMRGRKVYSPEIDKAADFIAAEFKAAGLQTWNNSNSYRQEFSMVTPKQTSLTAVFDGQPVDAKNFVVVTSQAELLVSQSSGFEKTAIQAGDNLFQKASSLVGTNKNLLVLVDTSFTKNFPRLTFLKRGLFTNAKSVVFFLGTTLPSSFSIETKNDIAEQKLANVVGILPGKSKKNEYVIFSGHYDHIGVSQPVKGDSINNGANDDAAGITAVIMLAKYFKKLKDNERTIVFAAFTAEEIGGFGSTYFSRQFDPAAVMAMFNIEMIGTESKWGKNSAFITGYEKTNMGEILQKNLEGTTFTFYPDPYPQQDLFYRSDNATLARLGVPAHTISTTKIDTDPNYHKVSDQIETLDLDNMVKIIKSIALSSRSIVAGVDTPTRVKAEDLSR
jgi:hypothetical protein